MASKVFGYQRFPSKIFELDTDEASKNETEKRLKEMLDKNPALAEDESFMVRNNTYAMIPAVSVIYNTRAQTSLFRNIFLILQENNTNEAYLECSFDHFNCKLTRLEHFIHDVYLIFNPLPKQKKKRGYEIPWLNENFVQRFYNNSMTFHEFADSLVNIFDFKSKTDPKMIALCWKIYSREVFFRISGNTLVTQLEDENLRKIFEIFTHLDNNVMCKISPFLMNQFLTWWISESGIKLNRVVQSLTEWYNSIPKDTFLDFPEFTKQIYRLFLSGTPVHIYKTLIIDAWDCVVSGVVKKGLLEKVGPNKGRWLPRIMYLHVDKIDYFKRKTDGTLEWKGVIHLGPKSSVQVSFDEDKIGFFQLAVVCSKNQRRYLLRADDQRVRHLWVTSIQNVLDVMKGSTKPMVLEKPLKFVQDIGDINNTGEITKLRSFSTNDSCNKLNTLNGEQLIFKKRHSDDFTKHFQINCPNKLSRSSSFTKERPVTDFLFENPRVSISSKRSSMSDCMDMTISPHPGNIPSFFKNSVESDILPTTPEESETHVSTQISNSDSSCGEEYETMSNHSHTKSPYVVRNLSKSMRPASQLDVIPSLRITDSVMFGMTKSQTLDDFKDIPEDCMPTAFVPEPVPRPTASLERSTPVPAPRQKRNIPSPCVLTESNGDVDPMQNNGVPKIPPRRIPKVPQRTTSKRKTHYVNTILLNKL